MQFTKLIPVLFPGAMQVPHCLSGRMVTQQPNWRLNYALRLLNIIQYLYSHCCWVLVGFFLFCFQPDNTQCFYLYKISKLFLCNLLWIIFKESSYSGSSINIFETIITELWKKNDGNSYPKPLLLAWNNIIGMKQYFLLPRSQVLLRNQTCIIMGSF